MRLQDLRRDAAVLACGLVACRIVGAQAPSTAAAALTVPSGVLAAVRPAVVASITSADKRGIGTFSAALPWGKLAQASSPGGEADVFVRGSGPLDEDDSKAPVVLADLQGYRKATKVEAGLSILRWQWRYDLTAQRALCAEVFRDRPPAEISDLIETALKKMDDAHRKMARDSIVDSLVTKGGCTRLTLPAADRAAFDKAADYGRIWMWNVVAEYGRQDSKFADTVAVSFGSKTEHLAGASTGVGVYFPDRRLLIAATGKYESGFEEGAPRQYCIPNGPTPATALQCRSVALAAPDGKTQMLIGLEGRWFANASIGVSPRITVDLHNDNPVGFELPILLRQPADAGFTTALILGARSRASSAEVDDRAYVALEIGLTYGVGLP